MPRTIEDEDPINTTMNDQETEVQDQEGNGKDDTSMILSEYEASGSGFKALYPDSTIDKREFVRLALQALNDIGYSTTAATLEKESGFTLELPTIAEFRESILNGKWERVERLLLDFPTDQVIDTVAVRFLIRQQKFLEALEGKETKKALSILRNELAPLNHNSERLHFLSSLIMCSTPQDLRVRAEWDGATGASRQTLLQKLQHYIDPSIMIPQRRLETLLEQAKSYQRNTCLFHANDVSISLLADCDCNPASFPSETSHILREHTDEIWRLEFSHNGKWLATAGKDKSVIIWNVLDGFSVDNVFLEHTDSIACLAWSPDDSILLTAAESSIKMWSMETGECIATLNPHEYPVGALSWTPDGKNFVSGGMDSKINFWDLHGDVTSASLSSGCRIVDLAVTPDGKKLVTVGRGGIGHRNGGGSSTNGSRSGTPSGSPSLARSDKRITIINMATREIEREIVLPGELTSVSISKDSRYAIVSHAPDEILYVDLKEYTIVRRFLGHHQGQYVLQSCFGGAAQNYVLSGSEDGEIYVWHRDTSEIVMVLSGHGPGSINSVAWNPKGPAMFASVSDDRTVRIWTMPAKGGATAKKNGNGTAITSANANGKKVAFV